MRSLTFLTLTMSSAAAALAQQPDRPRCRDCTPSAETRASAEARAAQERDSLRARAVGFEGDIERIAAQLLIATQVQTQAERALRAWQSGRVADATQAQTELAVRRLREQLDEANREIPSLRSRLSSLCDRKAKPDGYMGITFSATMSADAAASGAEVFRFAENPTVETVEPGSPAEQAGVAKGDEIILIDGKSVVGRPIVFSRLLRPGSPLSLRVRRDGDTRDVTLMVGQRPASMDHGCPFLDARIMAAFGDPIQISQLPLSGSIVRATTPMPPGAVRATPRVGVLRPAEAPPAPGGDAPGTVTIVTPMPMVPSVPLPAPNVTERPARMGNVYILSGTATAPMVIAGATVIRTNADLQETFGVKNGVLVLDVARGSSAFSSGLRGGDVIVAVGRMLVTSPLAIQRAIQAADGTELPLRIIRKKKEQSLTLRW